MLVVSRKKNQSILIGEDIEIIIANLDNGTVKLAIKAPKDVTILRKELKDAVTNENKNAILTDTSILKKLNR